MHKWQQEIDWKDVVRFYFETGETAMSDRSHLCILGKYLNLMQEGGPRRGGDWCVSIMEDNTYKVFGGVEEFTNRPTTEWETLVVSTFDARFPREDIVTTKQILSLLRESVGVEAYDDYIAELDAAMEKELVLA